jgi:hypothetical protein
METNQEHPKMLSFVKWRMALQEEDIQECGHRVRRPFWALEELYDLYLKYGEPE